MLECLQVSKSSYRTLKGKRDKIIKNVYLDGFHSPILNISYNRKDEKGKTNIITIIYTIIV